ncbi:MAG: hypothetical protein RhofKO_30140 [Rhodothermales bacterium]
MRFLTTLAFTFCVFLVGSADALAQKAMSWADLGQVEYVKEDNKWVMKVAPDVASLAGQEIKIEGFIMPLEQSQEQRHFILSGNPVAGCNFCMPGGPESMIEVKADTAVEFSYDPVTIVGTLEILKDDPNGLIYRLTAANPAS